MLKMNSQIREFFRIDGSQDPHFKDVRFLSEEKGLRWDDVEPLGLTRAWYELSRISPEDRVEFSKELWLQGFSYHPSATSAIESFFDQLDDIAVVLSRQSKEEPWTAELVYSLADNSSFFRGMLPAEAEDIDWVKEQIEDELPRDYWAFFRIHNGFGRLTELGLIPVEELKEAKERLENGVIQSERPLRWASSWIDPTSLYPFFEEFGTSSFQCFNAEWYPGNEMGNVYFSGIDYTLSDISDRKTWADQLAYPTFLQWLAAFLEGMNTAP